MTTTTNIIDGALLLATLWPALRARRTSRPKSASARRKAASFRRCASATRSSRLQAARHRDQMDRLPVRSAAARGHQCRHRRLRLRRRFPTDFRAGRRRQDSLRRRREVGRQHQAIIVPKDLPIKTLADLKGKRVAFGKGSSAHNLLVAALEKAGLSWGDISPAPLAPADATAAFVKGSVDAWSIWDPYLALAELKENARVIAFDKDVHKPNAFYIAGSDFVDKHPALVRSSTPSLPRKAVGGQPSRGGREGTGRGDRCRYRRGQDASSPARATASCLSMTKS